MMTGWFQSASLVCLSALAFSCQSPAAPSNSAKPTMPSPAPTSPTPTSTTASKTFEEDVAFLSQHAQVVVLSSAGGGRIALSAQYQARVMTSAIGEGKPSLGFINRQFIE